MDIVNTVLNDEQRKAFFEELLTVAHNNRLNMFREYNKIVKPGGMVFVGDSITEQMNLGELLRRPDVYNRGISGDTTSGVLKRMEESIFALKPSKLFLLIGTNDIYNDTFTKDETIRNIKNIIVLVGKKLPDTKIYLESIYPISFENNGKIDLFAIGSRTNEKIDELNEELKLLAQTHGIEYIDVNKHLKDKNGNLKLDYTIDGLHISVKGYIKVMEILKLYLDE